jgi:hypothetical protein
MKRLALLVIIITLPLIAYYQYQKFRRFNPPSAYDYVASDSIDINYHSPETLQHYYENVFEIGAFARRLWHNQGIDVRYPDQNNSEAVQASQYYQQLLKTTAYLEDRLIQSQQLKQDGFTNADISTMEENEWSPQQFQLMRQQLLLGLKQGDEGGAVWRLQELLRDHGHDIPVDGIFNRITEQALKDFQQTERLYPSGQVDESSLRKLLKL